MNPDRLRFYRNTLHPFLSIAIPFLLLLSVETFVRAMVLHAVLPLPGYLWAVLLLVGVIQAVAANRAAEEGTSSIAPRLRELLLILIGTLVLFMLAQGHLLRLDINPVKADVLYPLALTFVYWIMAFGLHRNMREREAFLALVVDQDGDQLKTAFRDYSEEATTSSARMRALRRAILWFQSLSLIAFLILLIAVDPIEPVVDGAGARPRGLRAGLPGDRQRLHGGAAAPGPGAAGAAGAATPPRACHRSDVAVDRGGGAAAHRP